MSSGTFVYYLPPIFSAREVGCKGCSMGKTYTNIYFTSQASLPVIVVWHSVPPNLLLRFFVADIKHFKTARLSLAKHQKKSSNNNNISDCSWDRSSEAMCWCVCMCVCGVKCVCLFRWSQTTTLLDLSPGSQCHLMFPPLSPHWPTH